MRRRKLSLMRAKLKLSAVMLMSRHRSAATPPDNQSVLLYCPDIRGVDRPYLDRHLGPSDVLQVR